MGQRKNASSNSNSKNKNRRRKNKSIAIIPSSSKSNFVSEAGPGCYIARPDMPLESDWIIGWEDVDPRDFQGQEVPDLALDPEEHSISICNIHATTRVAYVTVYDTQVRGKDGTALPVGSTIDNNNSNSNSSSNDELNVRVCVTFIILCPPRTFCHLCFLDIPVGKTLEDVEIDSDVQDYNQHPSPNDTHPHALGFPFANENINGNEPLSFLCTQGECGQLTHFFTGNLHAIDFRCDPGTPLLAVGDGVVVEVRDDNTLSGIAVSNLFQWNSVLLQIDVDDDGGNVKGTDNEMQPSQHSTEETIKGGPLFVEYVHIQAKSSTIQVGDRVTQGQMICRSGSVGFSPEPHLHFAAYRSQDADAPTVRVKFLSKESNNNDFLPEAGAWYNANGRVVHSF